MTRDLTAGLVSEVTAALLRPIMLFEFFFDSSTLRFWTGLGDLSYGGDTYAGAGQVIGISDYQEQQNLEARGITFTVSGISSSVLALALAEPYQGRVCNLYFAAMTDAGALVADPYLIFSGFMDVMEIVESGETSVISVSAENKMIILTRPKVRRYTPEDQRQRYPGDKGLDFVPTLQDKEIVWKK